MYHSPYRGTEARTESKRKEGDRPLPQIYLLQSSYEVWGAAVQPGSNGSSDPQQCQYWKTLPESGVSMVPPLYTLSNFLLVSPKEEGETNQAHHTSKV